MNRWIVANTTGSYCRSKIVKHVVSHNIFTSYTRNVRLQRERKPLANSTFSNSVIQIWPLVLVESQWHTIVTSFWDGCCFLTSVQHLEASVSFFTTSCQRHSSAAGARDARFYPTHAPASMDKISRTMNTEFREQHTFKIERSKYNNKIHNIWYTGRWIPDLTRLHREFCYL